MRSFDLGGRVLDIVPIPGHTDDSIALYDRRTGILPGGDTVYPGRIYVSDFAAFRKSIHRLAEFTRDKPVAHDLALRAGVILEMDRALAEMGEAKRIALRDLTIAPRGR